MKNHSAKGVELLQAAIILGFSGNILLRGIEPGINVLMWIVLLVAALAALSFRKNPEGFNPHTISLVAALVFFSAMFAFRDSGVRVLDALAILLILALLTMPTKKIKVHAAGVAVYALSCAWTAAGAVFGPFLALVRDIKWNGNEKKESSRHLLAAVKGLVIAFPLLFIFVALLMSADAEYQTFVEETFSFISGNAGESIAFTVVLSWLVLGYLKTAVSRFSWSEIDNVFNKDSARMEESVDLSNGEESSHSDKRKPVVSNGIRNRRFDLNNFGNAALPDFLKFGKVETCVILGLMNLVFLSFVIIQAPYLFGGMELVQSTPDFKLAEYARRGVGELIVVSLLVLPVLLSVHWLLRKNDRSNETVFRILAWLKIGLLFVIMLSALQRLLLLTGSLGYGLTAIRFYAVFLLIFLAMVFVWFAMTVLRGERRHFAWGALWSGLFLTAVLHFVNPDAFIVRTNVELMRQGRSFDATYNASLSADAVPVLIESLKWMNEDQCDKVVKGLRTTGKRLEGIDDYLSWNWSRSRALGTREIQRLIKGDARSGCRIP